MVTQRPFEELNLWQRIFVEHWDEFAAGYEREGYYEYTTVRTVKPRRKWASRARADCDCMPEEGPVESVS